MANIRLDIEYDGSSFHGWQQQPDVRTIQEELHKTLELVLGEKIHTLYSSGRTDAGVPAKQQVVNFFVDQEPDLRKLTHAVSNLMKREVAVTNAEIVSDSFHSRTSALAKRYVYTILYRSAPAVLDYGRVWQIGSKLDIEKMAKEARGFEGKKDFSSFRCSGCSSNSPVKTIHLSELTQEGDYLRFEVIGSGFLKQMVRTMVGTLVEIGKDSLKLKSILEVLEAKDRKQAGVTAPAFGLLLDEVFYDSEILEKALVKEA